MDDTREDLKEFKFNFGCQSSGHDAADDDIAVDYTLACEELWLKDGNMHTKSLPIKTYLPRNSIELRYISDTALEDYIQAKCHSSDHNLCDGRIVEAIKNSRDVLPGVIEGGFTVWDGSKDLIEFLVTISPHLFKGKLVLEAGCGSGLPGLFALHQGAKRVVFQDYNRDVLTLWTIPNVSLVWDLLNKQQQSVEFYSGDWLHLAQKWINSEAHKFDVILTAETVYRMNLYPRLHRLLEACLAPLGTVYLACKASYGVGGNIYDFMQFVIRQGVFSTQLHQLTRVGVIKYIVQMKWKTDDENDG